MVDTHPCTYYILCTQCCCFWSGSAAQFATLVAMPRPAHWQLQLRFYSLLAQDCRTFCSQSFDSRLIQHWQRRFRDTCGHVTFFDDGFLCFRVKLCTAQRWVCPWSAVRKYPFPNRSAHHLCKTRRLCFWGCICLFCVYILWLRREMGGLRRNIRIQECNTRYCNCNATQTRELVVCNDLVNQLCFRQLLLACCIHALNFSLDSSNNP